MILTDLTVVDWAVMHPYMTLFLLCGALISATVVLSGLVNLVGYAARVRLRGHNIAKYGWPPPHCDADGDAVSSQVESLRDVVNAFLRNPPNELTGHMVRDALRPVFGTATEEVVEAVIRVNARESEKADNVAKVANVSRGR